MNPALVDLALQELPVVIDRIKELFAKANPGAPVPTSQDVIDAYNSAYIASKATDEAWKAAHPKPPAA